MAPLPKRRHSTRRGGKRWRAYLKAFSVRLFKMGLTSTKNKHLRSLRSNGN